MQASGVQVPLAPVGPMLAQATALWDGVAPARITVERPNDANALVTMTRDAGRSLSSVQPTVLFAGATGALKE
ncbi:PepSY domain-containing protein, partial [Variovorax sp. 2RAF20]